MSEVDPIKLSELLQAADDRRDESIRALVPEREFGSEREWVDLIASEAVALDKRMRFLHRYRKLPAFVLGTNVPIREGGATYFEQRSYHTPLLFETQAEFAGSEHAISMGLTASSYLHDARDKERSVNIKHWLVDTAPDGTRTQSPPDEIMSVSFRPDGVSPRGIDGVGFWDFKREWLHTEQTLAKMDGEAPDYEAAMKDIAYPDELYMTALGCVRAFNRVLKTRIKGPLDTTPIEEPDEENWADVDL